MCVVCGCSETAEVHAYEPTHGAALPSNDQTDLHFGLGAAKVSVPGMGQERAIQVEASVLGANQKVADANRVHFAGHRVHALNLVSSPGSGKTTLLCATILALQSNYPHTRVAVIEGDQQTSNDAERIRSTGVAAVQVNTGKGCHLDAPMVARAFTHLHSHEHNHDEHSHTDDQHEHSHSHTHQHSDGSHGGHGHSHPEQILFIENVGNLVCPALWDLGEAAKVVVLSVTEGEDKPLKYPDMFAAAQVMVLNKTDLLPYLDFDVRACIENARRVNPTIEVLQVSAKTGTGMDAWLHWLTHTSSATSASVVTDEVQALQSKVAQLEAQLQALQTAK